MGKKNKVKEMEEKKSCSTEKDDGMKGKSSKNQK